GGPQLEGFRRSRPDPQAWTRAQRGYNRPFRPRGRAGGGYGGSAHAGRGFESDAHDMSQTELLLAVDGGGSKTRALLADVSGAVVGRGTGGSSNYHVVGLEAAGRALQSAIDGARKAVNGSGGKIVAACFGLASVDRPSDQLLINGWVSRQGLTDRFCIVNDSELVLAAGTPEGWGIALICGT